MLLSGLIPTVTLRGFRSRTQRSPRHDDAGPEKTPFDVAAARVGFLGNSQRTPKAEEISSRVIFPEDGRRNRRAKRPGRLVRGFAAGRSFAGRAFTRAACRNGRHQRGGDQRPVEHRYSRRGLGEMPTFHMVELLDASIRNLSPEELLKERGLSATSKEAGA